MEKVELTLKSGPITEKIEAVIKEIAEISERAEELSYQLNRLASELKNAKFEVVLPLETKTADSACDTISGEELT